MPYGTYFKFGPAEKVKEINMISLLKAQAGPDVSAPDVSIEGPSEGGNSFALSVTRDDGREGRPRYDPSTGVLEFTVEKGETAIEVFFERE